MSYLRIATLFGVILLFVMSLSFANADYTMFRSNLSHTGEGTGNPVLRPATIWVFGTGDAVASTPAVASGIVYVGSNDGNIYALNATNGKKTWNYSTSGAVHSSPAVVDGVVYVGSRDGNLYALNSTNGYKLWNCSATGGVDSSPAVSNGVVYVGSFDRKIYAMNATNGDVLWTYLTGSIVDSSAAVVNNTVFIGSQDSNMIALDATTGQKLWNYSTGNPITASPAVVNGVVYVGSWDSSVYALNSTNGSKIWSYETEGTPERGILSSPAVIDGVVYIGSCNANLYALNAINGSVIWKSTICRFVYTPTVVGDMIYVGANSDYLFALNKTNGLQVWNSSRNILSSIAFYDGVMYFGDANTVRAVGTSLVPAPSSPPTPPIPDKANVTVVCAMTDNGSTVELKINGNITSSQMHDLRIATNTTDLTTTLSFNLTGETGTSGFGNITIPRTALPYGKNLTIYIDNMPAENQGYSQDADNFYVWYTCHFSIHKVSIVFGETPTSTPIPQRSPSTSQPNILQIIYGLVTGLLIASAIITLISFLLISRSKNRK